MVAAAPDCRLLLTANLRLSRTATTENNEIFNVVDAVDSLSGFCD